MFVSLFFRILNSTMFESWAIVGPYPSWWVFNVLLLVLQVLHIIWSYLIARIAVKAVLRGKVGHWVIAEKYWILDDCDRINLHLYNNNN